jgi:hypothetical protein
VLDQALHDHEGFTTDFDIKVFVIMETPRENAASPVVLSENG